MKFYSNSCKVKKDGDLEDLEGIKSLNSKTVV
jgi:hypothetical protein